MSWITLGVNEWSASDATDGLPISGSRAWPTAADAVGDVGIMLLSSRGNVAPPSAVDWELLDSYVTTDETTNGLRSWYVYKHVRGASNPSLPGTWVTSYVGLLTTYRHSSATTFTFGTVVKEATDPSSTSNLLSAGVASPGADSLIIVGVSTGRGSPSALGSVSGPGGAYADTEDTTTAPSASQWYGRVSRTSGASPNVAAQLFDAVLGSGNTGAITATVLNTKGSVFGFSILPSSGGDTTPPVITGPGGATGATSTASIAEGTTAVHTFTANEAVTWSKNGGADSAAFNIDASTGALTLVLAPNFESPTDVGANNTYVVVVRATDTASNATDQEVTVTVTDIDDTAPVLSSPAAASTGQTTANGNVSSNEAGGLLYYYAHTSASRTGAAIRSNGVSQVVSSDGVQNVTFTGLVPATTYYAHYVQVDENDNESNVVSIGTPFSTDAASLTLTSLPLKDQDDVLLASTLIAKVAALKLSDMTVAETWVNVTTDVAGVLTVTGALTAEPHLLVTSAANGLAAGAKLYTPA